ncbi:hypothetical protein [Portibacter marinus]|uniref:hypothetical protein n=1 Tax=Portibacter marinus TaxID=2898660 RepID=UPI001F436266|nr:hypothetical protein [Portibacter marinus]
MKSEVYKLNNIIKKNGFIYQQIRRSAKAAIYKQVDPKTEDVIAFEVFKISIQRSRTFEGRFFPKKEKFPSNEDFGKIAWSVKSLARALLIFNKLNQ